MVFGPQATILRCVANLISPQTAVIIKSRVGIGFLIKPRSNYCSLPVSVYSMVDAILGQNIERNCNQGCHGCDGPPHTLVLLIFVMIILCQLHCQSYARGTKSELAIKRSAHKIMIEDSFTAS